MTKHIDVWYLRGEIDGGGESLPEVVYSGPEDEYSRGEPDRQRRTIIPSLTPTRVWAEGERYEVGS